MRNKSFLKDGKAFIIAEAGVNHNGSFAFAKKLIVAAKECKADAVKFQTFDPRRVISRYALKADYQKKGRNDQESQLEMLKKYELRDQDYFELSLFAQKKGIFFLSTPKDIPSAQLLEKIHMPIYKIGSSEINNFEFLKYIALRKKPIILSTGMSTLNEVKEAFLHLRQFFSGEICLLHCVSQYPCPFEAVNLLAMETLRQRFHVPVGYSDHTVGYEASLAAISLGARILEKHFTLDNTLEGPDHVSSLNPNDFFYMVQKIRNIECCLGDGQKKPALCEIRNRAFLRRSLVFSKDLNKGHRLMRLDITIKRPGTGLEPKYHRDLIGRILKRNVQEDQIVEWSLME